MQIYRSSIVGINLRRNILILALFLLDYFVDMETIQSEWVQYL